MSKVIRIDQMKQMLGLSKSCIYQLIKDELLPNGFKISRRAVGWLENDVQTIMRLRSEGKSVGQISSLVREINARANGQLNAE